MFQNHEQFIFCEMETIRVNLVFLQVGKNWGLFLGFQIKSNQTKSGFITLKRPATPGLHGQNKSYKVGIGYC